MLRGNEFGRVSLCLCVCPVCDVTFESVDLETSQLRNYVCKVRVVY